MSSSSPSLHLCQRITWEFLITHPDNYVWLCIIWSKGWQQWLCSEEVISSTLIGFLGDALLFFWLWIRPSTLMCCRIRIYVVFSHTNYVKAWKLWLGQTLFSAVSRVKNNFNKTTSEFHIWPNSVWESQWLWTATWFSARDTSELKRKWCSL